MHIHLQVPPAPGPVNNQREDIPPQNTGVAEPGRMQDLRRVDMTHQGIGPVTSFHSADGPRFDHCLLRILHTCSLMSRWDMRKVSMLRCVSIHFSLRHTRSSRFDCRWIKYTTPLTTFLRTLHQALFRPPFLARLFIGTLPPTRPKQEQKIFDNSPGIICTIPMRMLAWSVWRLAPLVELEWRSYSRRLISEAVFCRAAIFVLLWHRLNEGVKIEDPTSGHLRIGL